MAKVIVAEAKRRGPTPLAASGFEALPGRDAQALGDGVTVTVGGPCLLNARNAAPSPGIAKAAAAWDGGGKTVLLVIADRGVLGAFAVEDEIRPESRDAAEESHRLGMRVGMITGLEPAHGRLAASAIAIEASSAWRPQMVSTAGLIRHLGENTLDRIGGNLLTEFTPDLKHFGKRFAISGKALFAP